MKKRFNETQIIGVLQEQEAGGKVSDICRRHGISDATFYNWKSKYGGLEVSEAKRLRALEDERIGAVPVFLPRSALPEFHAVPVLKINNDTKISF